MERPKNDPHGHGALHLDYKPDYLLGSNAYPIIALVAINFIRRDFSPH